MKARYRLLAAVACVIVAFDCFDKQGGELQLPYWLWAVVGVCWLGNALAMFTTEAA